MVIDGSTQPGFLGKPLIVVDGSQIIPETFTSNSGVLIYSSSNQVKNISFAGFNWNGLTLEYADATNNTIAGCWVGLDANGSNAAPNAYQGIFLVNGAGHNVIGGTSNNSRNVISGNAQYGIWMSGSNTTGNVALGNYIGTDALGGVAVSNAAGGVILTDGTSGNLVGGTNAAARNVISGNVSAGLWIVGSGVCNNFIQGNFIGLDAIGTTAVPNSFAGLFVLAGANSNRITGNVISGNYSEGIRLADVGTTGNVVQGNYIGTDVTGVAAIPNGFAGLTIYSGATSNLVGGTTIPSRNVISGNASYGVVIGNTGTSGNLIQGNYIGSSGDGLTAVPNYSGILFSDRATNNTLGGTTAGAANLVSGNNLYGVFISDAGTSGNRVQGNLIGTDRTGTNPLGNYDNVELQAGATGNFIGGVAAGAGNVIAFAGGTGVILYDTNTTNNSIRCNSVFNNYYLGIDLNGDGVTPNHNGFLPGPDNLQNFPVITNAYGSGSTTMISGTLNSLPNQSYGIDVYRNVSPDDTGYGEGQFYAGSTTVTTDGSGNGSFSLVTPAGNFAGQYFTATATSAANDTSEFSLSLLATNQAVASEAFTGPYQVRTNGFAFTLTLEPNFYYRIQATTNLTSKPVLWIDLTNFTATSAVFNFIDRAATNYNLRFYRVISP
ncbi:MAG: hypothetical protein WDN00_08910 [Limisphaerales bacterium]